MSKPSWRNLMTLGAVKRTDQGFWARPEAIRVLPGFNLRDVDAAGYRDDIESLKAHMRRGGKVPALEVSLSEDGLGVDLVDGHRRTTSYHELIAEGQTIEWIRIEPFEGNDKERHARILTSQDNRKLLPLELAEGYRRMKALFGMSNEELAAMIGKSRQHVEQLLLLASAPDAVHALVRTGELSATVAIETVREHGDGAAKVLGQAKQEAQAAGKKRITIAALREWTPPAKAFLPMMSAVGAIIGAVPEDVRTALTDKDLMQKLGPITLPAEVIFELLTQQGAIDALRHKAKKKLSGKPAPRSEAQ